MEEKEYVERANRLALEISHRLEVEGYSKEDRIALHRWLKEALAVAEDAKR